MNVHAQAALAHRDRVAIDEDHAGPRWCFERSACPLHHDRRCAFVPNQQQAFVHRNHELEGRAFKAKAWRAVLSDPETVASTGLGNALEITAVVMFRVKIFDAQREGTQHGVIVARTETFAKLRGARCCSR